MPQKARQARDLKDGKTKRKDFTDPSMDELYDYIGINRDHRPEIKRLVGRLEDLQERLLEFRDKYKQLKLNLRKKP